MDDLQEKKTEEAVEIPGVAVLNVRDKMDEANLFSVRLERAASENEKTAYGVKE